MKRERISTVRQGRQSKIRRGGPNASCRSVRNGPLPVATATLRLVADIVKKLTNLDISSIVFSAVVLALSCTALARADWPSHRMDAGRTAYTSHSLPKQLVLRWIHTSPHAPMPAWPRSDRMDFDRAYQVVVAGGQVVYGSSVDGIVYALDAESGEVSWQFHTDAPVRFAPAAWRDRVFVASDDGHLYALRLDDGHLIWKQRGGPDDSLVLGNERLVSKWPARGGPVVVDDTVYFAAGIWPSEGIYLYALDADSGNVVWCNDDSGAIYMPQPHGGANAESGVSAQGYLAVAGDRLFVPTGRAVPAAFDRLTGEFQYFHLQKYGHNGGSSITAVDETVFNGGIGFNVESGDKAAVLGAGQLAATAEGLIRADQQKLEAYHWSEVEQPDRRGQTIKTRALRSDWSATSTTPVSAMIVADKLAICGSVGRVEAVDMDSHDVVWSSEVDGIVYGLAASDGRLLVSTDRGRIYCFDGSPTAAFANEGDRDNAFPQVDDQRFVRAAEEIVRHGRVTDGYCVDLGCGDGSLSLELARRTNLQIYAVEDDEQSVAALRNKLSAAGVYGDRIVVHCRDLNATGYPPYLADLIVSGRSVLPDGIPISASEASRLQRPCGGTVCTGLPGDMSVHVREALPGAGSWTHQYANAANTLASDDTLVGGDLGMLWFRDVDFDIAQRHGRAPAPLYDHGRIFHAGLDGVVAVDAYNGRELWRYAIEGLLDAYDGDELMGVAGTGSNLCVCGDGLYVRDGVRCLRLDPATGKQLAEFTTPSGADGEPGTWGYVACDQGVLYGTVANDEHIVTYRYQNTTGDMSRLLTESHSLFAMNGTTGELLWQYSAEHSIRHNAIAIDGGKVFLIDRPLAMFDRQKRPTAKEHPTGRLLALDATTGEPLWTEDTGIYGTMLSIGRQHGVLLMSYQPTRFRLDSELGGRMTAFRTEDGQKLWEIEAGYESRPLINGDVVYAQGGAWSLLTGEPVPFNFKRSYGCGILAASTNLMVFRSATLGYFDFQRNEGIGNYGGIRPGCWVNTLPAGGLVLLPDATAGCRCSYLNRAWIALVPQGP